MSDSRAPYLPISNFDIDAVSEELSGLKNEKSNKDELDLRKLSGRNLPEEVAFILLGMGMEKYIPLFKKMNIALDTFLNINESELGEIGITDENDRRTIMKNLFFHQQSKEKLIVSENHMDDLTIIKNVHYQLLLLQNYCAYVELQMRKHKFTDYVIDSNYSACSFVKLFVACGLTQSELISNKIYKENDSECLIEKLLKAYNLTLPNHLENSLPKKKTRRRFFLKVMIFLGCSSLVVLTGRYLIRS